MKSQVDFSDYMGENQPESLPWERITNFPYHELDGEAEEADESKIAITALVTTLQWFLGFIFYSKNGKWKSASVAFKRLLAFVYKIRPDLLGGATMEDISVELGESRAALNKYVTELTCMFGDKGINQKVMQAKLTQHYQMLRKFDASRKDRATTIKEWLSNPTIKD